MLKSLILTLLCASIYTACSLNRQDPVDQLFHAYQHNQPGAAVMVIHHGQVILNRNYGLADLEHHIAVTDSTNFRLASVTKAFTAMAILQLMDQHKLDFSTHLVDLFPAFPAYGDSITYGQLLHHMSGLIDYEELIPDTATAPLMDQDVLDLLMNQDSTYFPPGSDYRYSNGGYAVLALTVERLSGLSYAEYLKQHIFEPLGMRGSLAYVKGEPTFHNRALGYNVDGQIVAFSDQSMTSAILGDGGVYASLNDMYKWDQSLYGTQLISQAYLDSGFTPWLENYGCGWRIEDYRGKKRISHTGSTCGFRNDFQRFPEDEFSVIVLTNRREPGVQPLAEALTDIYLFNDNEQGSNK